MRTCGEGRLAFGLVRFRAMWKCLSGALLLESVVCVKENVFFFVCRMFLIVGGD